MYLFLFIYFTIQIAILNKRTLFICKFQSLFIDMYFLSYLVGQNVFQKIF